MKINIILTKLLIVILLMFSGSCTDLDEHIYDTLNENILSYTDEEIESITGPVYSNLRYTYWAWEGLFDQCEESADLIMTPLRIGVGWGAQYILLHKHDFASSIPHFYQTWYYPYRGIAYCNRLLELPEIQNDKEKEAEFRAMRAFFYYILFDLYRNIPLITTTDLPEGYLPLQEAPSVVFDFIVSELNLAKEDLSDELVYGHMNYYTACMTLAKVYLNHNAWFYGDEKEGYKDNSWYEKALDEVEEVLSVYPTIFDLATNYKDPFMADISGCKEVIFAIPLNFTYANANYIGQKSLHPASSATFLYDAEIYNGNCAVPQFMDTYAAGDKRKTDTWLFGPQYSYTKNGSDISIYEYQKLKASGNTTGLDSAKIVVKDEGPLNYSVFVHSIDNPGAYKMEGARLWKNEIVPGEEGTRGDDVCFYRLADAMFIKAECLLRIGRNKQEAADLVSLVRKRSFPGNPADAVRTVADLEGGSVYDYGLRETQKDKDGNDVQVFTTEGRADIELGGLLDDLAWEFVGEHHRRQDLIRFRLKDGSRNVFNGKSRFCYDASSIPLKDDLKKNIYPIFHEFMEANKKLVQNPGYN